MSATSETIRTVPEIMFEHMIELQQTVIQMERKIETLNRQNKQLSENMTNVIIQINQMYNNYNNVVQILKNMIENQGENMSVPQYNLEHKDLQTLDESYSC